MLAPYGLLAVPSGNAVVMMVNTPMTVRLRFCCPESGPAAACDESVTCNVKAAVESEVLELVGVP
jgi:hypothetical protein